MMKKSQILAAIALAMALGVVAPVVSAENASAVASTTDAAKAAKADIKAIKASFGPISEYDANGDLKDEQITGSAAYTFYANNVSTVEDAAKIVPDAKKDGGAATTAVKAAVTTAIGTYSTLKGVTDITGSANAWGNADLATVVANSEKIAQAIVASIADLDEEAADYDTKKDAANAAAEAVRAEITAAKINDAIKTAIAAKTTETGALQALYQKLTGKNSPVIEDEATLNTVLTAVQGKMPKIALYNRINKQVTKVEDAIDNGKSDATINEYLATLKKLVNGQITPDEADKENEKNDNVNAPATGIAGTAEGTATTVSIVAGLATALTALGAGVVAYRSARRK